MDTKNLKFIIKLIRNKKYKQALNNTEIILTQYRDDFDLLFLKSFLLIKMGKNKEALKVIIYLNKKTIDKKDRLDFLRLKAYLFYKLKNYQREIICLKKIVSTSKKEIIYLRRLFLFYYNKNRLKEAEEYLNKLIKIKKEPIALGYKGSILLKKGKFKEALYYFSSALKLSKRYKINKENKSKIITYIAFILFKLNRFKEANIMVNKALLYDKRNKKLMLLRRKIRHEMR